MKNLPTQEQDELSQPRKAALSSWIGSTLEFYDFLIYATASALVFPQLFFPSANPSIAIIASLATYAVGYAVRPVGALVLGHLGDTVGRKAVLLICLFLSAGCVVAARLSESLDRRVLLERVHETSALAEPGRVGGPC